MVHGPGPSGRGRPPSAEPPRAVLGRRCGGGHRGGRGVRHAGRAGAEGGVRRAALRAGRPEGHGGGGAPASRELSPQHPEAHGYAQGRLSGRHPGAGTDQGGGLVRYAHRAAQPYREPRMLLLRGERPHRGGVLHSDPPHHSPHRGAGAGPPLGGHPHHQALYRRRLRQQAGRPV